MRRVLVALQVVALAVGLSACGGDALALDPVASAATKTVESGSSRVEFTIAAKAAGQSVDMTGTGLFDYRNARGASVRDWNAPLDALFLVPVRRMTTIGVGDGGNEIGMGNVRARVARTSPALRAIASVVKVDHLVVAGTSNWGAYGIVAELSALTGQDLLHSAHEEARMVEACVQAGAVDGLTRRSEPTVDGLPLAAHVGMLELLRVFAGSPRGARPTRTTGRSR